MGYLDTVTITVLEVNRQTVFIFDEHTFWRLIVDIQVR